jgi:hypothetical protein
MLKVLRKRDFERKFYGEILQHTSERPSKFRKVGAHGCMSVFLRDHNCMVLGWSTYVSEVAELLVLVRYLFDKYPTTRNCKTAQLARNIDLHTQIYKNPWTWRKYVDLRSFGAKIVVWNCSTDWIISIRSQENVCLLKIWLMRQWKCLIRPI